MPKMKTKSGVKKRFWTTGTGKVRCKQSHTRHRLISKSKRAKRNNRGTGILCEADARIVLDNWLPYSR